MAAPSALVLALMGWGSGLGIVWGLGMALFWIAVIAVIVVVLRAVAGRPNGGAGRSALEVLEERYARGEITRDDSLTGAQCSPTRRHSGKRRRIEDRQAGLTPTPRRLRIASVELYELERGVPAPRSHPTNAFTGVG